MTFLSHYILLASPRRVQEGPVCLPSCTSRRVRLYPSYWYQEALGPDAIRAAQEEWPRLILSVREEMEKGTDQGSEEVQALAKRWKSLIQAFSGGNSQIEASVAGMYQAEPDVAAQQGLDPALFKYIGAAMRASS